jgi:hypothetical protein
MTLIEFISKLNINLFIKPAINYTKVMPLLVDDYIAIDISDEEMPVEEPVKELEFIDLELGNGYKLINEEKIMYFYNKV